MKSKFFLLGFCALALVACSIDETTGVNDTNAISFKATTATRATAATTNNIDAFTVWAWNTVGTTTSEFMRGVKADKSGSTFVTVPTYYWPRGTLDFYAFIPAATVETESSTDYNAHFGEEVDLTGDIIETANGSAYDDYKGYVANAAVTYPSAISFDMHVPANAAEGIDLCYAVTLGQSSGTVGLNFRHALSQVAFKAMNGNADWTVDIKGITLCGIYKEGTYTLPTFGENGTTAHNATDAEKGTWTIEEGAVQGRFNAGIAETVLEGTSSASQSITASDGALMLIPQTVAPWDPDTDPTNANVGAYIRINCQVTDETGEQIWPNYHELDDQSARLDYADITVPFEVDWAEGNLYTYTIVFGEGLGYYAPDDENTDLDGTPVLIPIRFTVDIDDFGNTDDVDVSTDTEEAKPLVLEYTITSSDTEIQLPIADVTYAKIDWGDGETETTSSNYPSHIYTYEGTFYVSISGTVGRLNSDSDSLSSSGRNCLTAVTQWGDTGLKSMNVAFYRCTNLTSLPAGSDPFGNVTSFDGCFQGCTSLKEVPEDLFKNCAECTTFDGAFYNCTSLVAAPSFEGLSKVTTFEQVFYGCTALTTLPENMFSNCTAAEKFINAFASCTALTTLPENMFSNCTAAESFTNAFVSCTALTTLPENMFSNCSSATDFQTAFSNCSSLTSVPKNLFADCLSVGSFYGVFWNCSSLEYVPVGIFDNNTLVTNFRDAFGGCSNLKGESPCTEIDVTGTSVKVHLYERENYPEYFTAPTAYKDCFKGATFSDMDSIPSSWGGNAN